MRVGVVTKWFNRGQPVVGRHTRSALDSLGHETFVLARPKKEKGPQPGALSRDDVWDQPGVTEASAYDIPLADYVEWIEREGIDAILCDQNYGFTELAELRKRGVLVLGRFVWEHFTADHVERARSAYDVVFSMTRAEQERYRTMGLDTPYVPWGCHPELVEVGASVERESGDTVTFVFTGGFLGRRKPLEPVLEAWAKVGSERARLIVKAQVERSRLADAEKAAAADSRIELRIADEPTRQHLETVAAADVTLSPARWEGLGLPLYEAVAFGQPAITNAVAPMDEITLDGANGLTVPSRPDGEAKSGIPAHAFDTEAMAAAITRLAEDDALRAELAAGAAELRDGGRAWEHTVRGFDALLELAAP
ncbi:MAG TPA: glycosyltransferase [Solirubrobacterales bacterium]|nr:glycosyltransferase [Solirubrobacterales bacterium]